MDQIPQNYIKKFLKTENFGLLLRYLVDFFQIWSTFFKPKKKKKTAKLKVLAFFNYIWTLVKFGPNFLCWFLWL